jgi:Fe2+ transport system protein FeoA
MNKITIADLKKGAFFVVRRVRVGKEIGKRLADMGFVSGAEGQFIRQGLLGDPLQVKICHYNVSLRRVEALGIEVDLVVPELKKKINKAS